MSRLYSFITIVILVFCIGLLLISIELEKLSEAESESLTFLKHKIDILQPQAKTNNEITFKSYSDECIIYPSDLAVEYDSRTKFVSSSGPRFGWKLALTSDQRKTARNQTQSAYRIMCYSLNPLISVAAIEEHSDPPADLWDTGKVLSSNNIAIPYEGRPLQSYMQVLWWLQVWDGEGRLCRSSNVYTFEVAILDGDIWNASWLTTSASVEASTYSADVCRKYNLPVPIFRHILQTYRTKEITKARVYITGLGFYSLFINGDRVGEDDLAPAWTNYEKTVFYDTYDITSALAIVHNQAISSSSSGSKSSMTVSHVLVVEVGNGWYNLINLAFWGSVRFSDYMIQGPPMFKLQLMVWYNDGTTQSVGSYPDTWKASDHSATTHNSIYIGEKYDARLVQENMRSSPIYDDSFWLRPVIAPRTNNLGSLILQTIPPVRRQSEARVAISQHKAGKAIIYDFQSQLTGRCRLSVSGNAGSVVTLRYGELLYHDGSLNVRTSVAGQIKFGNGGKCSPKVAFQTDAYTLKGGGHLEEWTPMFTWHAFRYVEITHVGDATVHTLTCYPMRTDVAPASTFTSSNTLLNEIHEVAMNTVASNMIHVLSDCPHRERLGYGGDILMVGEGTVNNFDMTALLAKVLQDFVDAQRPNGGYTETSPFVGVSDGSLGGHSGPIGWQSVVPVAALWQYRYYGDERLLQRLYPSLLAYVTFLDSKDLTSLPEFGLGDWMAIEPKAKPLTALGFFYQSYSAFATIASIIGHLQVANIYHSKAQSAAALMNRKFLNEHTGIYSSKPDAKSPFFATQCGQAMPLFLQLVPEALVTKALDVLADNIRNHGHHLQVGGFGVKYVLMALSDGGLADLAYDIMTGTSFPSFGFMLHNQYENATALWESWHFSNDLYSHNHPLFSGFETYLIQGLGGIRPHPDARAFDHILIQPKPPRQLSSVKVSLHTVRGYVKSAWQAGLVKDIGEGDPPASLRMTFKLWLQIPPNTVADVTVPGRTVFEQGLGLLVGTAGQSGVKVRVGSGSYVFYSDFE